MKHDLAKDIDDNDWLPLFMKDFSYFLAVNDIYKIHYVESMYLKRTGFR
jgi:hypothetical protein